MAGSCTSNFRFRRWKVLFAFVLMACNLSVAQENIRFERISVNEGLTQSDVKTMVQDRFGFLWIGTRDGLNKYDGSEFIRYNREKNDSTSIQFNQIHDLQIDSVGDVWIGSTGGVSIYNYPTNSFQNFFLATKELQAIDINHILLTGKQRAILCTTKGILNFDRKLGRFMSDPAFDYFKRMRVWHAQQNDKNGLWIGTDQGVFVKSAPNAPWQRFLDDASVHHIYFDVNAKVYLSTSKGLFVFSQQQKTPEQIAGPGTTSTYEVLRLNNGDLWVASDKVIVLDKNDAIKYVLQHDRFNNFSLSEDRARVLFQTHDDVVWVGTFGYGLNKFNPEIAKFSFLNEQTPLSLPGNYVSTIYTNDDTTLFIGTSRGLGVINLKTKTERHFSRNDDLFQILKIIVDKDGTIWLTTSMGVLQHLNGKLVPKNSLRGVYDLAEWDSTHLVLASRLEGIYLVHRESGKSTSFIPSSQLPEEVSCLLVEDRHMWVGCKDGLRLYDRGGRLMKHFTTNTYSPSSLHASFVKSLYRDSKNNLWVGTWGGGVSKLNAADSSFTTYDVNNGLPNNVVYGILEDQSGTLWLSTNMGLSAFDQKTKTFRNFNFFDGLQSNEFNTGAHFKSQRGKMYFGGVNGLTFFSPEEVLRSQHAAPIIKTAITIANKPLTFHIDDSVTNALMIKELKLDWKQNDIGLKFTTTDFKYAQRREFQYSVQNDTWYDIGNRRSLELIDLPNGDHQIKLRTRIPGEEWSTPVILLHIEIVPPIWEKFWFRMSALLALVFLVYAVARYRVIHLRRANAALNKIVAERTTEIQAMNEEIASQNDQLHVLIKELEAFSYSVSHDLRAPLRAVIGYSKMLEEDFDDKLDEEGRRLLSVIRHNAIGMSNLIDALLEFAKLGRKELTKTKIDSPKFVQYILEGINASTPHKAQIKVGELPTVYGDSNLLSQVWINLISNAIKYSSKKDKPEIEIGSYQDGSETVFYIKDNGAGFDMNYADKLFGVFQRLHRADQFQGTGVGLALVQRIINKHGGRVWAEGKVGEGAKFYFSLPRLGY